MSAIFSECGLFRYRLERAALPNGIVYAYFGVNGSTAGAVKNDHTVSKWFGFTLLNKGSRMIVGNPFAYCATDVRQLTAAVDPIGPDNDMHLAQIIADADILVPSWGPRAKVPKRLRYRYDEVEAMLVASGKPMKCFGLSKSGDPLHPLMLGYDTPLVDWVPSS
jgi:hypothetical protein